MRYIIFQDFGGKAVPFLFPDKVEFVDMREQMPYTVVLNCGNVALENGSLSCSGGDKELGVVAGPDDARLIASFFTGKNRE